LHYNKLSFNTEKVFSFSVLEKYYAYYNIIEGISLTFVNSNEFLINFI